MESNVVIDFGLAVILGGLIGTFIHNLRYLNRPTWAFPKRSMPLYALGGMATGAVALTVARRFGWTIREWDWILVGLLGAAVGVGELASRYRDEPTKAILTVPATIYRCSESELEI
jgi:hypothetical protein